MKLHMVEEFDKEARLMLTELYPKKWVSTVDLCCCRNGREEGPSSSAGAGEGPPAPGLTRRPSRQQPEQHEQQVGALPLLSCHCSRHTTEMLPHTSMEPQYLPEIYSACPELQSVDIWQLHHNAGAANNNRAATEFVCPVYADVHVTVSSHKAHRFNSDLHT